MAVRSRRRLAGTSASVLAATLVAGLLMACDSDDAVPSALSASPSSPNVSTTDDVAPLADPGYRVVNTTRAKAERAYAALSEAERVGQLFMIGVPSSGTSSSQRAALKRYSIGNVYLSGNTSAGRTKVNARVGQVRTAITYDGVRPFVAADQEGGQVQRLRGTGFERIPSALAQGTWTAAKVRSKAKAWGSQLRAAGVNLDLAPVADIVPAKNAKKNQPIGRYDRQYGSSAARVAPRVVAFTQGMEAGGVDTTVKHFPGLGRATGNTDVTSGVTDPTTRYSSYLKPFRDSVRAGVPFLMVSSATYPKIDKRRKALFSSTILRGMVRGDLGFDGVIVTDDIAVKAFNNVTWGNRATQFLAAGGTVVLSTSAGKIGTMTQAVRTRASSDPTFGRTVKAAVLTVLEAKARAGLL